MGKLHFKIYGIVISFVLLGCSYAGCTDDSGFIDFQLSLNNPEVQGKQVTVNGGVVAPIERIQWEWGDGAADKHHFFPASHTYDKPGRYEIKVTAFDSKNHSASKSVSVDIK